MADEKHELLQQLKESVNQVVGLKHYREQDASKIATLEKENRQLKETLKRQSDHFATQFAEQEAKYKEMIEASRELKEFSCWPYNTGGVEFRDKLYRLFDIISALDNLDKEGDD